MATDKQVSQRLERLYGITLGEYNIRLELQSGVCKICGRPPTTRRLHTDHDHSFRYLKVHTEKIDKLWFSEVTLPNQTILRAQSEKKNTAIQTIRKALKRASVRGLLCPSCNRGLKFYSDNPNHFLSAARYLQEFNGITQQ